MNSWILETEAGLSSNQSPGAQPTMLVYLNGRFVPRDQATISIDDRGFLFGDGLYEVIRSYGGLLFESKAHWQRLRNGLQELRLHVPEFERLHDIALTLLHENGLQQGQASIYFQITRGAARPRQHAFPSPGVAPTIFASANPLQPKAAWAEKGIVAVTVPDLRWRHCDLKSTNLLANVLANQQAHEAGAEEAIFVRGGKISEGSHSNVFAVLEGVITTSPQGPHLLPGITRQVVLSLCAQLGLPWKEREMTHPELIRAEEVFITLTSGEVTPVVRLDHQNVGEGRPGILTQRLQEAFREYVELKKSGSP